MTTSFDLTRQHLIHEAFGLEFVTIGWMVIEGAVAIVFGIIAHSVTLLAFGLDSGIELISATVLLWRLSVELRSDKNSSERAEKIARKIGGALLFALAAYVIARAVWALWNHSAGDFSLAGLLVAAIAIPLMYLLSKAKLRVAERLGSAALRADAAESIACGYLSFVVVIGFIILWLFGLWWIDAVTSVAIVYFLLKEGREAWEGHECCDSASESRSS